jgi:dihydroorotate dehydrogenase (NAD+) catalytic subunit
MTVNLKVNAGGLLMKNPVATASGTAGYGEILAEIYDPQELGALVTKGLSLKPRPGNPPPRIAETPCGMLNAIGLENIGLEAFLEEKLPLLQEKQATVVVNFFGETEDEYVLLAERLSRGKGIHGLEMNISCPNVKRGGIEFGTEPGAVESIVARVRKATPLPLWVKLSPNVADISDIARAAENGGADALTLINTLKGMAVDLETRKPALASVTGGLSGPAIKPVALRMVYEARRAVKVPIIGAGGIMSAKDALEFIIAGACAVQIGTAAFVEPMIHVDVIQGIKDFLEENNINDLNHLIGSMEED